MQININRQLIGLEDLLIGDGKVTQTRNGIEVEISKVSINSLLSGATINVVNIGYDEEPYAELSNDGTLTVYIPQGVPGVAGEDGRTPQYEFLYNEVTGNIEYNLIGYTDESEPSVGVWN